MMKLLFVLATILLSCLAINATHIDMRLRNSEDDIIYTKLFPKINKGHFYTGPLVEDTLSTLNFGLLETDVKLKRQHEDTILDVGITIAFDSFSLQNLKVPGFGTNDYVVKNGCGKGMRLTLKLKYDSDKDEFEKPKNDLHYHCVGDRKRQPFKLALDRREAIKGGWFKKKFNKLRGKILTGIANLGVKGKDSFIITKLENLALDILLSEINKEVQNPYAKDTVASLRKEGVTVAGPDSLSYILYQIMQQEKNVKVILKGSPLKKEEPKGNSKCLFKPAVTLENFKFKQLTIKLSSP